MLSSLSRSINKTPLYNSTSNCYENISTDNFLQQVCESKLISEGIFGIEQMIIDDYLEEVIFTPQIHKLDFNIIEKDWNSIKNDIKSAIFYEIELKNPGFLPFDTKNSVNLLDFLRNINMGVVFSQILFCKKIDKWRENAISQYEEYLLGNDNPSPNKVIRTLQSKIIKTFRNFELKRSPVEQIEQKILSHGYRFEMRIILFDKNKKNEFEEKFKNVLKQMSFYNELILSENKYKKEILSHILDRRFQINFNNLLSEKEMFSLLSDRKVENTFVIEKPVKPLSNLKQIQNNYFKDCLSQLPFEEKKNLVVDKQISKQIQQAFNRVKISKESLQVTNIERGARLQKIEIKIPSDINYSHIKKNVENIQAALGKDSLSIEIGSKPETVNLYVACDDTELIYLKQILESPEFQEFAKDKVLPFILGEDVVGKPLFACLSEVRHLLIAGVTGSGKSVFLNCLLICLILYMNPEELVLYLIDPKMVELKPYEGFPQVAEVIIDMKKASNLLKKLTVEMDRRYEILSKAGYRDVMGYNKSSDNKIPYLVVIVDEYADLAETNPEVEDYIQRLGQKARSAGIHLVVATQRPSVDILDGAIKTNLPSRISFKLETTSDYSTVFGKGIPFEPLGRGDACARIEGLPKHYQRFQSPIITLDDDVWKKVIADLKKVFSGIETADIELPDIKEETPIEKLKRIIAETGETRVSELGRLMKIGNNTVAELIKELVDEGFLDKEGRGYVVTASEEELNKWKDDKE